MFFERLILEEESMSDLIALLAREIIGERRLYISVIRHKDGSIRPEMLRENLTVLLAVKKRIEDLGGACYGLICASHKERYPNEPFSEGRGRKTSLFDIRRGQKEDSRESGFEQLQRLTVDVILAGIVDLLRE
jgi:hypothetical protein